MKSARFIIPLILLTLVLLPMAAFAQQATKPAPVPGGAEPGVTHHGPSQSQGHGVAQDDDSKSGEHQHGGGGADGGMGGKRKGMKAKHDQMMAEMKLMDTRLDEKLAIMNAAEKDKKMAAMADVINELAAQRKQLHERFAEMHQAQVRGMKGGMMGGMMGGSGQDGAGHQGHGGGMGGGCPMMQKHQGSSGGQHGGHGDQGSPGGGAEGESGPGDHDGHPAPGAGAGTT